MLSCTRGDKVVFEFVCLLWLRFSVLQTCNKEVKVMGVLHFLGDAALYIVLSLVAIMIDRRVQSRKKGKSPTPHEGQGS
jgi:hypothetical protein